MELLVCRVRGFRIGIALEKVSTCYQAVELQALPSAHPGIAGLINVHNELLPVLDMAVRLGENEAELGTNDALVRVRTTGGDCLLWVNGIDEVSGLNEEKVQQVDRAIDAQAAPWLEGVLYVQDLDSFLSEDDWSNIHSHLEELKASA